MPRRSSAAWRRRLPRWPRATGGWRGPRAPGRGWGGARGGGGARAARAAVVAVALNALGGIEFAPPLPEDKQRAIELGQASRGIKVMIHARGEDLIQNSIRYLHPFGYLDSEVLVGDGTQLMIGFGADAE